MGGVSNLVSSSCKKIIKPYFPTPTSLRCCKLSYLDQIVGRIYAPMAFFYPKRSDIIKPSVNISQHLQNSLSKVLTHYYPYAGKLNDNVSVDCNDSGVEFFTTKINCPMSEIVNNPYADKQDLVFPKGIACTPSYEGSLAVIQLSHFDCGGFAISACVTHKIGDAYTIGNFINDWATITRDPSSKILPGPQFNGASFFPPSNDLPNESNFIVPKSKECLSRSFDFSQSKLASLKSRVINSLPEVKNLTDTEIVSAFIYQRAMATKNAVVGSIQPSLLIQAANLRPPVPKSTMGNIGSFFSVQTTEENEIDLPSLVGKLRKAKEEYRQKYKHAKTNELLPITIGLYRDADEFLVNNCYDIYRFSSIKKFPLYDVDFGWGKPERVSLPSNCPVRNFFALVDNKARDGMEVIMYMKEQDILALDKDEELLEFASPST
uniref:Acylsugar acyltransferase 3 n=1 Tax=Salpiglossis sinuata TaxID=33121 RepID=A0A1Y0B7H1_9SOLA|nr:acylsugar acyltransferase 3 [Salpiglossis sinuata]